MTMTPEQIKALAAEAAQNEDQTEDTGGDFEFHIPAAGVTVGRLIEYIELGKHGQRPYQGKPKPDAEVVRVTFELTHPKNTREIEVEGEKVKVVDTISLNVTKKLGEKARFKKLFNKMTYGRADIVHMAQMLNDAFVIEVVHNEAGEGDQKRTYANIDKDGEFKIGAPFRVDPLEGTKTPLNIPAATKPLRIFLFNNPTPESWASLFIEGTRTVKVEGKEEQQSKNWLQERIMSAKNFKGSPLDLMLQDVDIDKAEKEAKKPSGGDALAELDAKKDTVETADSDDLAALGL